jgi:hypothetical protein
MIAPMRANFRAFIFKEMKPEPDYGGASLVMPDHLPEYGLPLSPGESQQFSVPLMEIVTADWLREIEIGKKRLCVYVSLFYFDFAEVKRELQFCYVYYPAAGGLLTPEWRIDGPSQQI